MSQKRVISVNFYPDFSCIADQCPLTCCQEWRIAVDEEALMRWEDLNAPICSHVEKCDEGMRIHLDENRKCPLLNERKLCKLVLEYGEAILSHTCATFPRMENEFAAHIERTLSPCCPAVIDLLYREQNVWLSGDETADSSYLFRVREMILQVLRQDSYSCSERLMMSFYLLLTSQERQDSVTEFENGESESLMNQMAQTIREMNFQPIDTFYERNELFLDIIENYRKQGIYAEYLEQTGALAERICEERDEVEILAEYKRFQSMLTPFARLFHNYLLAETYNSLLMPDSELEDMLVAFEWIAIEYVVIQHHIFLDWLLSGKHELTYESVRTSITVLSRITGFDAGEVAEYIENSFEESVWDWGYLALIVGNFQ